jgi:hypothetical protein
MVGNHTIRQSVDLDFSCRCAEILLDRPRVDAGRFATRWSFSLRSGVVSGASALDPGVTVVLPGSLAVLKGLLRRIEIT